jgi:hypothetical protein
MSSGNLRLSDRATRTWRHERPTKEAVRTEQRRKLEQVVRGRLEEMFGPGYEVTTAITEDGNVIAKVDDVRFSTFIYNEEAITVIPIVTCHSCEKDVYLGGINDLAELGEALEAFSLGLRHECQRACLKQHRRTQEE